MWAQFASSVTVVPGQRVLIQLDPERAGIDRDLMPEVARRLAVAARDDGDFWPRTQAAGVNLRVTPVPVTLLSCSES